MNPLPECCFPNSAPIPHQFVMKVYVDAWIYVTEKFVNVGNIELYEEISRYEKADYPPIPNFIIYYISFIFLVFESFVRLPGRSSSFQCSNPIITQGIKGLKSLIDKSLVILNGRIRGIDFIRNADYNCFGC